MWTKCFFQNFKNCKIYEKYSYKKNINIRVVEQLILLFKLVVYFLNHIQGIYLLLNFCLRFSHRNLYYMNRKSDLGVSFISSWLWDTIDFHNDIFKDIIRSRCCYGGLYEWYSRRLLYHLEMVRKTSSTMIIFQIDFCNILDESYITD